MTVWLVFHDYDYEGRHLRGVYLSREAAEAKAKADEVYPPDSAGRVRRTKHKLGRGCCEVEEWTVEP